LAVIFHHRLVKIHLFANGNGRHARLVADAIIIKNACKPLSWGGNSDLNKPDEIRKNYISALKKADGGDYADLIEFASS
jgi:Fic family protein